MTKISVIVPIYKVERYLDRCIQSLLRQTYTELEIILVDDGSPDNCGKICDRYAQSDSRIKVIHKENGGLSDARNAGIDIACGDYLGFVDSDDFIHPEMYEILYNNLISTGSDISICTFEKVYEDKTAFGQHDNQIITYSNLETLEKLFTFYASNFTVAWNKLYKRELFNDIRYPKGRIREDEFTTYKLIYKANKIVETLKPMYYYSQTSDSIMHSKSFIKTIHYADAIEERIDFYAKQHLTKFHHIQYKRYCLWMLCVEFRQKKRLINAPDILADIQKRREKHIQNIKENTNTNLLGQITFALSNRYPLLMGFFAFHKISRYNIVSIIAGALFDDRISLK